MANIFVDNRWLLDTASATLLTTEPMFVKRIRWTGTGLTAGVSQIVIADANDVTIWHSLATDAAVVESDLIERWWYNGFKIPTLAGGLVIIELL